MKIEITPEEVLELASKNEVFKAILMEKFPKVFKSDTGTGIMSDDDGKDSEIIKRGDLCHIVHGKPERYTITKSKYPNCTHGAVKIFRGDARGKINSDLYVVRNTKRFTLDDIEYALNYCKFDQNDYGSIVTRLNDRNHPDNSIHYKEDKLNCNNL